ncbi:glutamine synthetase, partial [bacterium]|nr:glutamine synthetase [bacterium]
ILIEAIDATENSELVRTALGEHVFNKLIENKKIEWDKYRQQVTEFEINSYLPIL